MSTFLIRLLRCESGPGPRLVAHRNRHEDTAVDIAFRRGLIGVLEWFFIYDPTLVDIRGTDRKTMLQLALEHIPRDVEYSVIYPYNTGIGSYHFNWRSYSARLSRKLELVWPGMVSFLLSRKADVTIIDYQYLLENNLRLVEFITSQERGCERVMKYLQANEALLADLINFVCKKVVKKLFFLLKDLLFLQKVFIIFII